MAEHPAVAFLRQAHERAEKVARALPRGPWMWTGRWDLEGNYMALEGPTGVPVIRSRTKDGAWSRMEWHPAFDEYLPDPSAVLRRVAAERQILAEHADASGECRVCAAEGTVGASTFLGNVPWPCRTVLLLAQAWGWEEETT